MHDWLKMLATRCLAVTRHLSRESFVSRLGLQAAGAAAAAPRIQAVPRRAARRRHAMTLRDTQTQRTRPGATVADGIGGEVTGKWQGD